MRSLILERGAPNFKAKSFEATEEKPYTQPTIEETEIALEKWLAFARKCKVISGTRTVSFDPYEFQRTVFRLYWRWGLIIVGKPRQMGLTETFTNIFLWQCENDPAFSAAIFSKTGTDTTKISERAELMAVTNPDIKTRKANTEELALEDGGTLLFRNSNPEGARSLASVSTILFDEYAYVQPAKSAKKLWAAAKPSQQMLGNAARCVVVSTPPPPPADPKDQTHYMELLTSSNGDRKVAEIADKMRSGEIAPVQYWIDGDGVSVDNACKLLVHWKAHPIYSQRPNHLESTQRRDKISDAVLAREHDLGFNVQSDAGFTKLEWFKRYQPQDVPARPYYILQSWDTASTVGEKSSQWAGITLFIDGGRILILDVICDRFLSPDGEVEIIKAAKTWKPNLILIENKSSALDIVPRLRRSNTFRYPIKTIDPPKMAGAGGNGKLLRFEQELPAIRDDRRVYLPDKLFADKWVDQFESAIQAVGTPEGKVVQDIPDALSQALSYIRTELIKPENVSGAAGPMLGAILK
jgi:phage terminase large subunit-like protein